MKRENEAAMRRGVAADSNLMIVTLKNAIEMLEECRSSALHSTADLAPVLGSVAELYGDTAQLCKALGVTVAGALEKLQTDEGGNPIASWWKIRIGKGGAPCGR